MKKLIITLFFTLCFITQTVSAFPTADERYALSTLQKLELLPDDYDPNGVVRRIDAVSLLLKIKCDFDWDMDTNMINQQLEGFDDAALYDEETQRIMAIATYHHLLKGSAENNIVLLNPNNELTWREALILVSRTTNNWFEFQYESKDEYLLSTTNTRGFITDDFKTEMLNQTITPYEWCNLANIVLHIPRSEHSYWGDHTVYYIDNFLY